MMEGNKHIFQYNMHSYVYLVLIFLTRVCAVLANVAS